MVLMIFPIVSTLILGIALGLHFKYFKSRPNRFHYMYIIINALLLLLYIYITFTLLITGNLPFVPAWAYWVSIFAAILIGILAFIQKYIPGQLLSAGLFLFTGFVSLFSIGFVLLILFIVESVIIGINLKKHGLKTIS